MREARRGGIKEEAEKVESSIMYDEVLCVCGMCAYVTDSKRLLIQQPS